MNNTLTTRAFAAIAAIALMVSALLIVPAATMAQDVTDAELTEAIQKSKDVKTKNGTTPDEKTRVIKTNLEVQQALEVVGNVLAGQNLDVAGVLTALSDVVVNGGLSVDGSLSAGATTLNGDLTVNGQVLGDFELPELAVDTIVSTNPGVDPILIGDNILMGDNAEIQIGTNTAKLNANGLSTPNVRTDNIYPKTDGETITVNGDMTVTGQLISPEIVDLLNRTVVNADAIIANEAAIASNDSDIATLESAATDLRTDVDTVIGWGNHADAGYLSAIPGDLSLNSLSLATGATISDGGDDYFEIAYNTGGSSLFFTPFVNGTEEDFALRLGENGDVGVGGDLYTTYIGTTDIRVDGVVDFGLGGTIYRDSNNFMTLEDDWINVLGQTHFADNVYLEDSVFYGGDDATAQAHSRVSIQFTPAEPGSDITKEYVDRENKMTLTVSGNVLDSPNTVVSRITDTLYLAVDDVEIGGGNRPGNLILNGDLYAPDNVWTGLTTTKNANTAGAAKCDDGQYMVGANFDAKTILCAPL
jgi:cytoskeletal protein CcmA (bactofilin family)